MKRIDSIFRVFATAMAAVSVGALVQSAASADAAPIQVTMVLQGTHPPDADYHLGTFTAAAPLCLAGSWQGDGHGARVFTCADGSGTFSASFDGEYQHMTGRAGPWQIFAGTGSYVTLRGRGSGSSVSLSEDPITFTNTWQGVVDLDAVPPAVAWSSITATHVRGTKSTYALRVAFSAKDDVAENPVDYTVTVSAYAYGKQVAQRSGKAGAGLTTVTLKFQASVRTVTVTAKGSDPIGNVRTIVRQVKLPAVARSGKGIRA